jgi:hypothetical protein
MKSKLRVILFSSIGLVLLAGAQPGCSGPDNPKIAPVPNVKDLAEQSTKGPERPKSKEKYGQGAAYKKAFDKPDPN